MSMLQTDSRYQIFVRLAPDAEELLSLYDLPVENMLENLMGWRIKHHFRNV